MIGSVRRVEIIENLLESRKTILARPKPLILPRNVVCSEVFDDERSHQLVIIFLCNILRRLVSVVDLVLCLCGTSKITLKA
jgi:hypothetical protein